MQNPNELFDIVDTHDQVTDQATRAAVHARGLRHRAVHVLLFNSDGDLLVQKRSASKDTFPGCYDSSASGHLDAGEDYDHAAQRELREELGLNLPATAITRQFKLDATAETGWEFVWVYTVRSDAPVTPHPGEIEKVAYMSLHQIEVLTSERPQTCAPAFCRIIREAIARHLFP